MRSAGRPVPGLRQHVPQHRPTGRPQAGRRVLGARAHHPQGGGGELVWAVRVQYSCGTHRTPARSTAVRVQYISWGIVPLADSSARLLSQLHPTNLTMCLQTKAGSSRAGVSTRPRGACRRHASHATPASTHATPSAASPLLCPTAGCWLQTCGLSAPSHPCQQATTPHHHTARPARPPRTATGTPRSSRTCAAACAAATPL